MTTLESDVRLLVESSEYIGLNRALAAVCNVVSASGQEGSQTYAAAYECAAAVQKLIIEHDHKHGCGSKGI